MNNFTELMNLKDVKGRTSLHYAAAIEDNNYLYKTLINRGADTSIKDNAGKTPGQYNKSKKELNKAMLLSFMNGTVVVEEKKVKLSSTPVSAAVKPSRKQILKSILKSMKSGPPPELEEQTFREDLDEESVLKVENIFKSLNKLKEKPQLGDKVHHTLPIDEATFQKIKKRSEYSLECSSLQLVLQGLCSEWRLHAGRVGSLSAQSCPGLLSQSPPARPRPLRLPSVRGTVPALDRTTPSTQTGQKVKY